ncbi:N-acetylmuramoyl-L-alanine amidase [Bacillus sp. AFS031507]|uniref:N-acetylmuramoyl-L-alanine amidase n=1 Tax=Bacillus sp. AFS031507 TaxID=2033496 RepID=UPI000BFE12DF|nr:N-acetylmuramoyl-L-alanine amidase [Bacillus sp. AFS031507]PGY11837.1 N-acetylmuramoyl-L-alanine amidase [Bacillus sp. AFS031507]
MKLYLDPGHGGDDPGAQGNGLDEKDITLAIALKIRNTILKDYENVQVKMSRTSDTTKSLAQRSSEANAWDADFFLAIHINSADSSAQGYEDFIYNGASNSSRAATVQDIIHAEVMKVNQLKDRGHKKANFHVIRETNMPALLTENGFISNKHDAQLMKDSSWQQKVAQGHVNGIAKAFGLKRKATMETPKTTTTPKSTQSSSTTVYTVYVGSYKSKENAQDRIAELKKKNINSSIVTTKISGATWYRVKVATYTTNANAEKRLKEIEKAGYKDAFIIIEKASATTTKSATQKPTTATARPATTTSKETNLKGGTNTKPDPAPANSTKELPIIADPGQFTIFGPTFLTPEQMNQFVKKVNPNAPELGQFYQTLGKYYGIRGDVAFAQAIHETDYFRFTGVVNPEQNNYSGIGATGGDTRGASFENQEEGVLAQLQHLYAYATAKPLPDQYPLVDPRFHLVDRGSAPTWTALNGKWAVPGTTYGQSILNLYEKMIHSG